MGFRFRRSVKLLPGVRLNFTTRGISATLGVRGASVNIGASGTHLNVGLPGTGISYRTRLDRPQPRPRNPRPPVEQTPRDDFPPYSPAAGDDDLLLNNPVPDTPRPSPRVLDGVPMVQYRSAGADQLTSPGLADLSELLGDIAAERSRIAAAIEARSSSVARVRRRVERAKGFWSLVFVSKARREAVIKAAEAAEEQLTLLNALLDGLAMDADFALSQASEEGFEALTRAFEKMKGSARVWDVSAGRAIDRNRARASHSHEVMRSEVTLNVANLPEVDSEFEALHFQNANGADLYLYPYFLAIPRSAGGFSLMDLREIEASAEHRVFVEQGEIPRDALIVGYSWERSNKDGSPDKRFAQNRQFPNCYYSELQLRSRSGLMEVYQFSNADVAYAFASTLMTFIATLPHAGNGPEESEESTRHSLRPVDLPAQPAVPSLLSGGVFVRAALLVAALICAIAIGTPEGRMRAEPILSAARGITAALWPESRPTIAPGAEPNVPDDASDGGLLPVPQEVPEVAPVGSPPASPATSPPSSATPVAVEPVADRPLVTVGSKPAPSGEVAGSQPTRQLTSDQLVTLQAKLIALGYQEGEPEGRLGPRVLKAFNSWRHETGRAPVVSIGPDEYEAFMRAVNR